MFSFSSNLEVLMMKEKKNYNVDDAIDIMFNENHSDLSGLISDKEKNDVIKDVVRSNISG